MQGINGFDKRKETFYSLRNKADIICLQETHSTVDCELTWAKQWGLGDVYFSHGTSRSKGTMICVKKTQGIEVLNSEADSQGRWIILSV